MSRIIESCDGCAYCGFHPEHAYCIRSSKDIFDSTIIPDFCPLPIPNYEQAWNDLKSQLQRDKEAGMGYKVSRALFLMEEMEAEHENN